MKKLLIVDDSNIIRSKIARCLGKYGLEIAGMASNGQEALAQFKATRCDLVTMDLTMPHMDGIECIRALREIDAHVRILVVSALADKATAILALKRIDTREASAALSTLQRELDASFEPYFRRGVTPDGTGARP